MNTDTPNSPCVCGSLRKGARIATQIYDKFLQPADLKVTQYSMLSAIRRHGDISIKNLAAETLLERTTCTRNLKILKNKALIHIQSGDDKRVKTVKLSTQGVERLEMATPLWEEAQKFIFSKAGNEETILLLEKLQRIVSILRGL